MPNIKILLASRSPSMRRLEREIETQPDMEFLDIRPSPMQVLLTAAQMEVDVVIIPLTDSAEPGMVSHLLSEFPDMTILILLPMRDSAYIVQRCPWRREILDASAANIVSVLRRVTREPCTPIDDQASSSHHDKGD